MILISSFLLDPVCSSRSRPWAGVPSASVTHIWARTGDEAGEPDQLLKDVLLEQGRWELERENFELDYKQNLERCQTPSVSGLKSSIPESTCLRSRSPRTPPDLENSLPGDLKYRFREGQRSEAHNELYEYGSNISFLDEDRRLRQKRAAQVGDGDQESFCFPRPGSKFREMKQRVVNETYVNRLDKARKSKKKRSARKAK